MPNTRINLSCKYILHTFSEVFDGAKKYSCIWAFKLSLFVSCVLFFSPQYGIVFDAGSSRTTVYVYEWPAEKENDTGVVSQNFKCNVKGEFKWKFLITF